MFFGKRKRKRRPTHPEQLPIASLSGTVLVVEDDPLQRIEIVKCLTRLGIVVHECASGGEAMETISQIHPHIVILDINLPGVTGIDLAVEIHNHHPDTDILMMTGDADSLRSANSAKLPVFAVLEKPVPLAALTRYVTEKLS